MEADREVLNVIKGVLNLDARAAELRADTPLLGAIPELDSMAATGILASLEERFGFSIADDEIDGTVFATVGSLIAFVRQKMAA